MSDPIEPARTEETTRRRRPSLLWVGGAIASAVLILAVNGTLSSWTTAIIDNNNNDVAVTGAVALVETGPGGTCDTGASTTNVATCPDINKYGGKMGEDTAGVPEADIEIARRTGCTKVNIDTDLRLAMTAAIRKVLFDNPKEFDPRKYLAPARARVKELVRHKVRDVLCCAGHAFD